MKWIVAILCLLSISAAAQTDAPRTVTMKEYVDMKNEMRQEMDRQREECLKEVNKIKDDNIKIALAAITEKLVGMNEFRGSLEDQTRNYITKSELKAWVFAMLAFIGGVSGIFWGYSKNKREKKLAEMSENKAIHSGDKVEVKK